MRPSSSSAAARASHRGAPYRAPARGGAGAAIMKNQNGVVIELVSTTQGASLKLAASGIRLALEK